MTEASAGPRDWAAPPAHPRVAILADDLIWATRLADAVTAAGGFPVRLRRLDDLVRALEGDEPPGHVIVDLTARAYDGVEGIRVAAAAGVRVVAVGQHDDVPLRRAAQEAGAERVHTYRGLFEDGPRLIAAWLAPSP